MTCSDDLRKRRQRAAYADYARLQWRLYDLAHDHPGQTALQEAMRAAEQHWRSLMKTQGTTPNGQITTLVEPMATIAERAAVSTHWMD